MKEKILAALKTKFQGIQDVVLDRIATKKAETVTNESEIQAIIDGLSYQDLINAEADFRASQTAISVKQKTIEEYEKKHNLKDGKVIDNQNPPTGGGAPTTPPVVDDKTPEWAKAIIESNKAMSEKIESLEKEKTQQSKQQQALTVLKASKVIPEKFKEKWANRINVDSETSIEDQVKELETEYTELHTSIVGEKGSKGLPTGVKVKGEVSEADVNEVVGKL